MIKHGKQGSFIGRETSKKICSSRDLLMLMVQNESSLYTHWEISIDKQLMVQLQFNKTWRELQKVIRVADITKVIYNGDNAHRYAEFPIPEQMTDLFIKNVESNRTYIVELGIHTEEGVFFTLLRSNSIATPINDLRHIERETLDWKSVSDSKPIWHENFSTYSYYENTK